MAYTFKQKKSLAHEVSQIMEEELSSVELDLAATRLKHKAIHQARKSFKKIRALLRLIRGAIDSDTYTKENIFYRNISRQLSAIRDAQALIEAWEDLYKYTDHEIDAQTYAWVKAYLFKNRRKASYQILRRENAMLAAAEDITRHKPQTVSLKLESSDFDALESGLKKVYKRGYKGHRLVQCDPSMEHIHDWRKRVKYLYHHTQLLNHSWDSMMQAYAGELKKLSDDLGLWRDLGLLHDHLSENPEISHSIDMSPISLHIIGYQVKLLHSAITLGKHIYQEKPGRFTDRIKGYWNAWEIRSPMTSVIEVE